MKQSRGPRSELQQLLDQLVDGTLAAHDRDRLADLLEADPTARQQYCRFICLHSLLQTEQAPPLDLATEPSSVACEPSAIPSATAMLAVSTRPSVLAQSSKRLLRVLTPLARRAPGGEFTVGALVVLVLAVAFWGLSQAYWNRRSGSRESEPLAAAVSPAPKATAIVATVRRTTNARWQAGTEPKQPASVITQGEQLYLTGGLVEIELRQGARLIVEAPAEWTIDGANQVSLKHGKVVAKVPQKAVGFALDTQTTSIVDLGTEFGVTAEPDGETHVKVFVGKVRLSTSSAGFSPSSPADLDAVELSGGEARRIFRNPATNATEVCKVDAASELNDQPVLQFVRAITDPPSVGFRRVEHGGTFGKNNLARLPEAKAFAFDWLDGRTLGEQFPPHRIENLNDGRYGNQFSWLGKSGSPPLAGIAFGGSYTIASIAFGRDNGGDELTPHKQEYDDFWEGVYTLQYTTVDRPDESTPADQWITLGTVEYRRDDELVTSGFLKPMLRHRYAFSPVEATGVRILVPGPFQSSQPACIDELEVYCE